MRITSRGLPHKRIPTNIFNEIKSEVMDRGVRTVLDHTEIVSIEVQPYKDRTKVIVFRARNKEAFERYKDKGVANKIIKATETVARRKLSFMFEPFWNTTDELAFDPKAN